MCNSPLVGRLCEAFERGCLYDGFTEGDDRVADLDFYLGVDVPQVVHHALNVQLASPDHHVLAGLLHLGREERVRCAHEKGRGWL